MRARKVLVLAGMLVAVASGPLDATEELPDDEFLEFLGVWDAAWSEACDPTDVFAEEDACFEYDDDDEKDSVDEEN